MAVGEYKKWNRNSPPRRATVFLRLWQGRSEAGLTIFAPVLAIQNSVMRHVADIPHPAVKITLLAWNGKFLLKLEQGNLEQTYKVAELDLLTGTDAEVRELLDEEFLAAAIARFQAMRADLQAAFDRQELR